jgi:hypothetical protein
MYVFPVSIIPSSLIYGKKEETRKQIYLFYIINKVCRAKLYYRLE